MDAKAVKDEEGETCKLNGAVQSFKAIRPCIDEWFGLHDVATSGHWLSVRTATAYGAGWTQRWRPFSRWLPDSSLRSRRLIAVFGRYTDLLRADMGVRIIHRSTDFYTVTKIYGWDAYYIFDGILYLKFYGTYTLCICMLYINCNQQYQLTTVWPDVFIWYRSIAINVKIIMVGP